MSLSITVDADVDDSEIVAYVAKDRDLLIEILGVVNGAGVAADTKFRSALLATLSLEIDDDVVVDPGDTDLARQIESRMEAMPEAGRAYLWSELVLAAKRLGIEGA